MKTLGLFCTNTSKPEQYTVHGFLIGPVMPTRWLTAEDISRDGLVGIYTDGSREHIKKWEEITGLTIPDCNSEIFPNFTYEIEQLKGPYS